MKKPPVTTDRIESLVEIMAALRDPDGGCPWDLEQDFRTIAPYTIEEAYEVADAIERGDFDELRDELGDLLFQVVYHAQMAHEAGRFSFPDVVETVCDKMIRRHPHVFGTAEINDSQTQSRAWEAHKAAERQAGEKTGVLDGLPVSLPALTRAVKLQRRAARVGFDWQDVAPVVEKIREECDELAQEIDGGGSQENVHEEFGDLLFAVANLARKLNIDPESALRTSNLKFEDRFRHIENRLARDGRSPQDATLDEMDALWEESKTHARG